MVHSWNAGKSFQDFCLHPPALQPFSYSFEELEVDPKLRRVPGRKERTGVYSLLHRERSTFRLWTAALVSGSDNEQGPLLCPNLMSNY